jgi:hypothetical protein
MLLRICLVLLFISSCATQKKNKPVVELDACSNGSVLVCFEEGLNARKKKDYAAAREFFKKGCELNHPFSCSEQGLMERNLGEMKNYDELQERACESMDAIACYNLACSYCLENDQGKTMEILNQASSLGYNNPESAKKDPDLKCLEKNTSFKKWLDKLSQTKKTSFPISYDFSYLKGVDLALRFPPSFEVTRQFPVLFNFQDRAQVSIFLSPDNYETCLRKIKDSNKERENLRDLKELNFIRNGYKAHIQRMNFTAEKKELSQILYVTGNERRCWIIDGVAESSIDPQIQKEIDMTVTSLVVKTFHEAQDKELNISLNTPKLKFAGVSSAGQGAGFITYYSPDGIWATQVKDTSIYAGYFVSPKLEDDELFRQKLGDTALKVVPYGFNYSEFLESHAQKIDGKMVIFYKTKAINKNSSVTVTTVFYQIDESKIPILMVHFQPDGKKEIISWEEALKRIVIK